MFAPPVTKLKTNTISEGSSKFLRKTTFEQRQCDVKQAPVVRTLTPGGASLHAPGNFEQTSAPARRGWDFGSIPVFYTKQRDPSGPLAVQMFRGHVDTAREDAAADDQARIHEAAAVGTSGPSEPLPFLSQIQHSFGRHDVSRVHAHRGASATEGAEAMGAEAFAVGDHVAFAGVPTLRTAAHEAAHVVQQRGGVQLAGGVGEENDEYEQHADAVAELVTIGRSSEELLDAYSNSESRRDEEPATQRQTAPQPVQRRDGDPPTANEPKVAFQIVFDKPLTKEKFIELTEMTIFGRRVNAAWTGVKARYKPSDSPVTARVPASALQGHLTEYGESASKVIQGIDKVQDAATFQHLNTILQKLTPAQWADYEKRVAGKATNVYDFEKSVDAYLALRQQRETERSDRDRLVTKLFSLDSLYERYRAVIAKMNREASLAAAMGTDLNTIGASPELIKMRDELNADLIKAGFPGGTTEFVKYTQDYLIAFRTETVRIGLDILEQYDSVLYKENERYQDPAKVADLHTKLAPMRAEFKEFEKNAQVYNEYVKNKELSRHPGSGHLQPKITEEQAMAQRGAAEQHKEAARQSVVAISDEFPVLKEDNLPLDRRLDKTAIAKADPTQLSALLKSHIQARRDDIKKTRETLTTEPDKIFGLDNLLEVSKQRQLIDPKSIFGKIIDDKTAEIKARQMAIGFLIAVLAIALTILTFGAAGFVAAGAAVGGFVLSSVLAYQEFKEYETKHAAYGTGLLSDDPSMVWVIVAVVGAAIDLGMAVKAVKAISPLAKTLETSGHAVADLAKFNEGLQALEKAGEIDSKIARSAEQAALARTKSAQAAEGLRRTLGSKAYSFPGPLADPDVYKDVVRLAYYKAKEVGYDFLKFVDEIKKARIEAKLGDLTADEEALLKKAYEEGKTFATEADLIKYMQRRPLGGKSIVVDENILIARDRRAKGLPLTDGHKRMLDYLDKNPDAKLSVSEELYNKVAGTMDTSDLTIIEASAQHSSTEYQDVIKELEKNTVGRAKGDEDRRIVADALFAKVEPGATRTLLTHDPGVYNRLLFMSGTDPAKVGKPVAEAFKSGFEVVINGRTLKVVPLPRK
jgi:hypothetical protein